MILFLLLFLLTASSSFALDAEDEFLGQFSTWTNVKTTYGAVGNGVANDTTALTNAFTALGTGAVHTLYFPAGTYLFSTKLRLENKNGVSIIGENPATTILKWNGVAGQDLIYANGMRYSRIARLTLDGSNLTRALVDQDWDNVTASSFDTSNEYLDIIWKNSEQGLWCGSSGFGCAETTIKRNIFSNIPQSCIQLWNPNALDMWVWDSTFTGCGRGVTNVNGSGAFRVYRSLFQSSTTADMEMGHAQVYSVRDNFSINSNRFFRASSSGNAAAVTLHGNTVIDSTLNETIQVQNHGPLLLFDNTVRIKSGGTAPQVTHAQGGISDTISLSNTFTVPSALSVTGRLLANGDTTVDRATIPGTVPIMPNAALTVSRTIFEVVAGSSTATIQTAINNAVTAGNKAAVHLQAGTTTLNATLTIPANADIQLVGDGYNVSILSWAGAGNVPMLTVTGPTKIRIQDLQFHAQNSTDAIIMNNIDQVGARVHLGQLQLRQGYGSHLKVNNLNNAKVEWINSNSAGMTAGTATQLNGGTAPLVFYSGASGTNKMQYTASRNATLLVKDMYYETNVSPSFATFDDQGTVVFDSLRIAIPALGATPGVAITNWKGSATFLGSFLDDRFVLSGIGTNLQFLGLGMVGGVSATPYLIDTTSPAANVVLANSRRRLASSSEQTANVGTADMNMVQSLTSLTRSLHPQRMVDTASGVSDIRLQRVWIRDARNAMTLSGASEAARQTLNPNHALASGLIMLLYGAPGYSGTSTYFDLTNNSDGTLTGFTTPTWVTAFSDVQTPSYDGTNDRTIIPSTPVLQPAALTWLALVKSSSASQGQYAMILGKGGALDLTANPTGGDSTRAACYIGNADNAQAIAPTATLPLNTAVWLGCTFDPTRGTDQLRLFANGSRVAQATSTLAIPYAGLDWFSGGVTDGGAAFNGVIGPVFIWDHALSDAEMANVQTAATAGFPGLLVNPVAPRSAMFPYFPSQ